MPSPRIACTHLPYRLLPETVKQNNVKVRQHLVYAFVSLARLKTDNRLPVEKRGALVLSFVLICRFL
jgi:hypothetical protein